jgi:hypothetical protein
MFPGGVDEKKILYRLGQRFTNNAINAVSRIEVTAATNKAIDQCTDGKQARDRGLIHFSQIEKVDQTKDYLVQKEEHDAIAAKPRLSCVHKIRFQKYANSNAISEPVEVEITGLPGNLIEKHKHYYIYSMTSNWGKSYNMDRLLEQYSGAYVPTTRTPSTYHPMSSSWCSTSTAPQRLFH